MEITYLAGHIFEICDSFVGVPQRTVHFLEGFCGVISGDALGLDIIEEVLDQVHFWKIPRPLSVFLLRRTH